MEEQELFLGMMQSCGICFMHQRGRRESFGIEHQYIAPGSSAQTKPKWHWSWKQLWGPRHSGGRGGIRV